MITSHFLHLSSKFRAHFGTVNLEDSSKYNATIDRCFIPDGYKGDNKADFDIALLRIKLGEALPEPSNSSSSRYNSICLPSEDDMSGQQPGSSLEVAGWGMQEMKRIDHWPWLQRAQLPPDRKTQCEKARSSGALCFKTDAQSPSLCKVRPILSECVELDNLSLTIDLFSFRFSNKGDAGAPLMKPGGQDGRVYQIGVAHVDSNGKCGESTEMVFTRIDSHMKWINETINANMGS